MQLISAGEPSGDCVCAGQFKQSYVKLNIPSKGLYLPLGQLTHALAPVLGPYVPAGQIVQTPAFASEYVRVLQLLHTEPATEALPAAQLTQAALLTEPAGDDVPAAQEMQVAAEICAVAGEYLPAAQSVQALSPLVAAYFPALQSVQAVRPFALANLPVLHRVQKEAPRDENLPSPHATHALSEVAPWSAE